jgi:hypothetical protein
MIQGFLSSSLAAPPSSPSLFYVAGNERCWDLVTGKERKAEDLSEVSVFHQSSTF